MYYKHYDIYPQIFIFMIISSGSAVHYKMINLIMIKIYLSVYILNSVCLMKMMTFK